MKAIIGLFLIILMIASTVIVQHINSDKLKNLQSFGLGIRYSNCIVKESKVSRFESIDCKKYEEEAKKLGFIYIDNN